MQNATTKSKLQRLFAKVHETKWSGTPLQRRRPSTALTEQRNSNPFTLFLLMIYIFCISIETLDFGKFASLQAGRLQPMLRMLKHINSLLSIVLVLLECTKRSWIAKKPKIQRKLRLQSIDGAHQQMPSFVVVVRMCIACCCFWHNNGGTASNIRYLVFLASQSWLWQRKYVVAMLQQKATEEIQQLQQRLRSHKVKLMQWHTTTTTK